MYWRKRSYCLVEHAKRIALGQSWHIDPQIYCLHRPLDRQIQQGYLELHQRKQTLFSAILLVPGCRRIQIQYNPWHLQKW